MPPIPLWCLFEKQTPRRISPKDRMNPVSLINRTTKKIPIQSATPTEIVEEIKRAGCDMLKGKLDGTETKEELVEYLKICRCPVLKEKFSGIK